MAAFPANLLFPFAVSTIIAFRLDPDIWLSPLMVLGTQWYILFNVIAGATAIPERAARYCHEPSHSRLVMVAESRFAGDFSVLRNRAITASGGSWNASIVAEVASWGQDKLQAHGIGAYIAQATEAGDYHRIVLGIAVMSMLVVVINRAFWRPLYYRAERKFRLG